MKTKVKKSYRKMHKTRKHKGGLFGVQNPFKSENQNVSNYKKYWKNKDGFSEYDRSINYPGQTNSLMKPELSKYGRYW